MRQLSVKPLSQPVRAASSPFRGAEGASRRETVILLTFPNKIKNLYSGRFDSGGKRVNDEHGNQCPQDFRQ